MTDGEVPEAEMAVLRRLWDGGAATVRDLADALYPGQPAGAATVQKLLERLENRECVARNRAGARVRYVAMLSRDEFLRRRLARLAAVAAGGSPVPLVSALVRAKDLDAAEVAELRALLAEMTARGDSDA